MLYTAVAVCLYNCQEPMQYSYTDREKGSLWIYGYMYILWCGPKNIYLYRIQSKSPSSLIWGHLPLESRKKNDSTLSAAWWTFYRMYRILCKVYTIGWSISDFFQILYSCMLFAVPLGTIWTMPNFFYLGL